MPITLRDLKAEARRLVAAGQLVPALAVHDHMLALNPLDDESRRRIPELIERVGDRAGGIALLRAVAMHDVRSGHPLPAIASCKILEGLGASTDDLIGALAGSYAHGSPRLAKQAARHAPADLDAPVAPFDPSAAAAAVRDPSAMMARAAARARDFSAFAKYPQRFLPVPFFSELPAEMFGDVVRSLRLGRFAERELVLREGDPGTAFYLVASGHLRVVARAGQGGFVERGELREGALFGEMALVTEQPRTASVQAVSDADVLEVDRALVGRLTAAVPELAGRLDRFARERLLKNLLASSPLFTRFDQRQQMELVKRFEGHDVAPGTVLIREGELGKGLFVVLVGGVEVLRAPPAQHPGAAPQVIARLGAGDLFGEMSLLDRRPTNATVRTTTRTTVLFLAGDYFRRLIGALPELRKYFENLANARRDP